MRVEIIRDDLYPVFFAEEPDGNFPEWEADVPDELLERNKKAIAELRAVSAEMEKYEKGV